MGFLKNVLESVKEKKNIEERDPKVIAEEIINSIGPDNIKSYDWCSTRVTIYVKDPSLLEIAKVKSLIGGIIIKGEKIKYVIGPHAGDVAAELGKLLPEPKSHGDIAIDLLRLLGGTQNIKTIEWCSTRLKLTVVDPDKIDEMEIKKLVPGVIKKDNHVQVIVGPGVEFVGKEVKEMIDDEEMDPSLVFKKTALELLPLLGGAPNITDLSWCTSRVKLQIADENKINGVEIKKLISGIIKKGDEYQLIIGPGGEFVGEEMEKLVSVQKKDNKEDDATHLAKALIPLLGGKSNIKEVDWCTTRLRLQIEDYGQINADEILKLVPGILERANGVQIVIGPEVEHVARAMKELLPELPDPHLAGTLIRLLGGAMNIACFQWCFTKLRIKVNDKSKVQIDEIEKLTSGVIQNGRDIEIVIGNSANCIGEEIKRDIE